MNGTSDDTRASRMVPAAQAAKAIRQPLPTGQLQVIWRYLVKKSRLQEFIDIYSPEGDWALLFRRCPGYLGTELLHCHSDQQTCITIDHWQSEAAYAAMAKLTAPAYGELDRRCAALTVSEEMLGMFLVAEEIP